MELYGREDRSVLKKRRTLYALACGALLLSGFPGIAQSGEDLLARAELAMFPPSYHATMSMTVTRPGKPARSQDMEVFAKKDVGTLMRITAPERSAGLRFLERSGSLWMYSPRAGSGKAIRLSPKDAFQGTHFSNNDVSNPRFSDDYTSALAGREPLEVDGLGKVDCLVLEAKASRPSAPYGAIRMWLLPEDDIPVRIDYYAKSGLLYKRMTLTGFSQLAGRRRPTVFTMVETDEPGASTSLVLTSLESRGDLADSLFTESYLTR